MAEFIEREAAIEILNIAYPLGMDEAAYDTMHSMISKLPAADVQPVRRGRWISDSPGKRFGTVVRLDKDGCPVGSCHCSECGEWLTASDEYPVIGYYCPNCGAKMDGGTDK